MTQLESRRDLATANDLIWIEQHYALLQAAFAGRWVAVRDGVVVADGVFLADLKDRCRFYAPQPTYRLIYPEADDLPAERGR